jgi:thioredoxin reductase (NADPH)
MSRYLIDRIEATPNIELHPHTELQGLHGEPETGLEGATWRNHRSGAEYHCPARNIFLFVGAEPETTWLEGCGVAVDKHGFVLTGTAASAGFPSRPAAALESTRTGRLRRGRCALGVGQAGGWRDRRRRCRGRADSPAPGGHARVA